MVTETHTCTHACTHACTHTCTVHMHTHTHILVLHWSATNRTLCLFLGKEDKFITENKNLVQELDASRALTKDETSRFTSVLQEKVLKQLQEDHLSSDLAHSQRIHL